MKVTWESVPAAPLQTLRVLDLTLDAFAGPLHAHDALELTWIRRGRGLRLVGDSVEAFGPGDLVLLPPRVAHTWASSGPQDAGPLQALVLQLQLGPPWLALPEWATGPGRLLQGPVAGWALEGALAAQARECLGAIAAADGMERLGLALALLGRIGRAAEASHAAHDGASLRPLGHALPGPGPDPATQRRVDALLRWVRQHQHTEVHARDAAAWLHVTPAAFSRAFKRLVGKPFSVYLNDLRIAEACLALRRTDRPVVDIATQCGYATLSHFNAQFRLRTGVSPREYRQGPQAAGAPEAPVISS